MNPKTWLEMVSATRIMESSLGDGIRKLKKNEIESKLFKEEVCGNKKYQKTK